MEKRADMISRTVHIDYEFTYKGKTYRATGADVGESLASIKLLVSEWRTSAIFDALGHEYDSDWCEKTFGLDLPSEAELGKAGFEFISFDVYF